MEFVPLPRRERQLAPFTYLVMHLLATLDMPYRYARYIHLALEPEYGRDVDTAQISVLIKRMKRDGLVSEKRHTACTSKHAVKILTLTEKGETRLARARVFYQRLGALK